MRVWVTGVGVVSALGLSATETFEKLVQGERGFSQIDLFDVTGQRASLGAQVRGVETPRGPMWSRATAFAHRAAREALASAGIDVRGARVGLVVGGTTAGMFENEVRVAEIVSGKAPRVPAEELRSHPLSSTTDALDASIGPFHRMRNVASACSSGVTALTLAMAWLREEEFDAVVAGGTDGFCRLTLSGFNALAATDPEACRPFDVNRRGLNLGEGAGFLVLERHADAKKRGRSPIAELAGASLAAEAHHITNPESDGRTAARVMREALARAFVDVSQVDYVNAHGTATPLNDAMESKAINTVFGGEIDRVWVSSSKGQIGHTLAAAGAIEAVIAAMCVRDHVLPPTAGLVDPDPACALRHVRSAVKMDRVRAVVSNSFGFGGMDGAIVVTEPELARERDATRVDVYVRSCSVIAASGGRGSVPDEAIALDVVRARRFDRSARLCAATTHRALEGVDLDRARCGVVFGSAYSSLDEAAAFLQRIFEKGPRLASPADFPNLVPSSPTGHASIYESLRGPALATADLRASGDSAIATAVELVAAGDADAFVAGAAAVRSELIDDLFRPLFDDDATQAPRGECAAAVLVTRESANAIASIAHVRIARTDVLATLDLPKPATSARVFGAASKTIKTSLRASTWEDVAIETVEADVGSNEAASAAAFVAAATAIAKREIDEALVVGTRQNVVYAFVLRRV